MEYNQIVNKKKIKINNNNERLTITILHVIQCFYQILLYLKIQHLP